VPYSFDDQGVLARAGLNLHAVLNVATLPSDVRETLVATGVDLSAYRQLILLGHGGRALWQAIKAGGVEGDDPVDRHSQEAVQAYLDASPACGAYAFLYPASDSQVSLIRLGELAGWHHASPFRVGINRDWGSWFAYRALVLADSDFTPVTRAKDVSPCDHCTGKPCISACPAGAVTDGEFASARCLGYRLAEGSACALTCLARLACPVGAAHRYEDDQIRYHYGRSLDSLRAWRKNGVI